MNDKPDIWNGVEHVPDEPKKKASRAEKISGVIAAIIMLIIILGLLNVFIGWAFGWSVHG